MMKKVLVIFFASVMISGLAVGSAFAAHEQGMMIDGSLSLATETVSGSGTTVGLGAGLSVDISDRVHLSDKKAKLQLRGDINYYNWDYDVFGINLSVTRVPVFVGGRYFLPIQGSSKVDVYVEGGLELSFDNVETALPFGIGKVSSSDINLGVTPGVGIEFPLQNNLVLGANARYHLITDSYMTLAVSLGYRF
jgi:opacity protein-like surface antigen